MNLKHACAFLSLLTASPVLAETVEIKGERLLQCKALRYGDYWILALEPDRFRILVSDAVASVKDAPPSPLRIFIDLPEPKEGVKPDPQRIRVYGSARGMARGLLDYGKKPVLEAETRTRVLAALAELLKDKDVEAEVFSCLTGLGGEGRVALAIEALKEVKPEGMEKRLCELALSGDEVGVRRLAAEEIKRRYGATPSMVLKVLTRKESSPRNTCAAADVVGVVRDPIGLGALAEAIKTKGTRKILPPRIPVWRGPVEVKQEMVERLPDGRYPELIGNFHWLDEEAPPLLVFDEVILPHLLSVLQGASGRTFKDFADVESYRKSGGK